MKNELRVLLKAYIECRDALAEAMNWHDDQEDPDKPSQTIPADRHAVLMDQLDKATVIADKALETLNNE